MTRLLIRPKPYRDETIISYCYRLADVNRCSFEDIAGNNQRNERLYIFKYKDYYLNFIERWGLDESEIIPLTIRRFIQNERDVHFLRNKLEHIIARRTKICPYCMAEDNCLKIQWQLVPSTVCLKHKVYLINTCPRCGQLLNNLSRFSTFCSCGCYLHDMTAPSCIDLECLEIQSLLESMIPYSNVSQHILELNNPMVKKSLFEFINYVTNIIKYLNDVKRYSCEVKKEPIINKYNVNEINDNLQFVLENWLMVVYLLQDWPHTLKKYLDSVRSMLVNLKLSHNSQRK